MNVDKTHGLLKTTNGNKKHQKTTDDNLLLKLNSSFEKTKQYTEVNNSNLKPTKRVYDDAKQKFKDVVINSKELNRFRELEQSTLKISNSKNQNNINGMFSKGKQDCESDLDNYEEILSSIKKYLKEKKRKCENTVSDENGVMLKLDFLTKLYNCVDKSSNVDSEIYCCPDEGNSTSLNENLFKKLVKLMVSKRLKIS